MVTVAEPTFEATQQMMSHPLIAVLAITGGPGIVAMGMKSGKKVIGAGAGNPPCIVDETADPSKPPKISSAAPPSITTCPVSPKKPDRRRLRR